MARTRQTARKSTGGRAPRRRIATISAPTEQPDELPQKTIEINTSDEMNTEMQTKTTESTVVPQENIKDISTNKEEVNKTEEIKSSVPIRRRKERKKLTTPPKPLIIKKKRKRESTKKTTTQRKRKKLQLFEPSDKVKEEITKFTPVVKNDDIDTSCCFPCSSKEAIRAVSTGNIELLKKVISDTKHVHNPFIEKSVDSDESAFYCAIKRNDIEMVKLLIKEIKEPQKRVSFQRYQLEHHDTGEANIEYHYGHAIRSFAAAKGNREGNLALVKDDPEKRNTYISADLFTHPLSTEM